VQQRQKEAKQEKPFIAAHGTKKDGITVIVTVINAETNF